MSRAKYALSLVEGNNAVTLKINKNGSTWEKTVSLNVVRHIGGGPNVQFDFNPTESIKAYESLFKSLVWNNTSYTNSLLSWGCHAGHTNSTNGNVMQATQIA